MLARLRDSDRRSLLTYWIGDALAVATLACIHPAFLAVMREFRCVVDDTIGGRISASLVGRLGGTCTLLPLPGDPERLRRVHGLIVDRASCAFPVDGGGPYRRVGTGLIGLASALQASIVPLAVHAFPSVPVTPWSRVRLPLLGSRVVCGMGELIPVQPQSDRRAVAEKVRDTLETLGRLARHSMR
jgi:lysophospholipid acyltransferase (LPLAT)-like uncharacterized protein